MQKDSIVNSTLVGSHSVVLATEDLSMIPSVMNVVVPLVARVFLPGHKHNQTKDHGMTNVNKMQSVKIKDVRARMDSKGVQEKRRVNEVEDVQNMTVPLTIF